MFKRILFPLVMLMVAVAVFVALKQTKPEKVVVQKPEKVWRVNTVPVIFQRQSPEITLYGRVETPRKSILKSALIADVLETKVLEGSDMTAGQLLVLLDDTDVQLLLQQRQAELAEINALIRSENQRFKRDKGMLIQETELLELTEKAVSRSKQLEKSRLASQATLDDALANRQRQLLTLKKLQFDIAEQSARLAQLNARLKRAEALVKQAEVNVSRTQVTAPYSGRVAKLSVAVGDRVREGDSLLSVYDLDNLEVRAQIPGRYFNQINKMISDNEPLLAEAIIDQQTISIQLDRLSGEVKLDSGGIDGLFSINSQSLALGSFVDLKLKLAEQDDVVALPFNALYGLNHVYRIKDGYLDSIKVERVGEFTNKQGLKSLLVRSDSFQANDQIVSTQLPNAITGLRVETLSE